MPTKAWAFLISAIDAVLEWTWKNGNTVSVSVFAVYDSVFYRTEWGRIELTW